MSNYTDFFGNEINVGDEVAYMQIGYRNLTLGRVIRITPKTLTIKRDGSTLETRQEHKQVIIKPKVQPNPKDR